MRTWRIVIDVANCEDCNNCFLACKDEHTDNTWPGYSLPQPRHGHRWIDILRHERGQYPLVEVAYLPVLCMHCENAPCIKASNGAVYRRDDGIVLIDPVKARGQKDLLRSCPYNVMWWNEAEQIPQKCTLCAHLLDEGWKQPRCAQACPTEALKVERMDQSEMSRIIASEKLECLHNEYNTRPRVFYKNLYRYTTYFIGGSATVHRDGIEDCASGATVTLLRGQEKIGDTVTDSFGEFKFDQLEPNSGAYSIEISLDPFPKKTVAIAILKSSLNLGGICLNEVRTRMSVFQS